MNCDFITKGKKVTCLGALGGVKNIYFGLYADYGITATAQVVASLGTLVETFKYEFTGNTNGLTETPTIDWNTGAYLFTQVLTGTFPIQDEETQHELSLLMRNRVIVFIEDYNSNIKLMGYVNSAKSTNGSAVLGLAKGDLTGYTIELTAEEPEYSPFLSSTAKTELLATVQNSYIG
tara:strand:+ start:1194 stop:1724 length:531 start_codon:yes stop_codon:yes gene_type:complete